MDLREKSSSVAKYKGDIVAGSLIPRETRKVAEILLKKIDEEGWRKAIVADNILQKRSPVAAKRQALLIRERLELAKPELWKMICEGGPDLSIQANLAAAIKHSRLLGDFMESVVKVHWRTFEKKIAAKDWEYYLDSCAQAEPKIDKWTDGTKYKLKQIVFKILAESGYIKSTRSPILQPVTVLPEIGKYLVANSEDYVLRCMEATQ